MKRRPIANHKDSRDTPEEIARNTEEILLENDEDDAEVYSLKERIRQKKTEVERSVLIQVLRKTGGNKAAAARLLQINYSTIHLKIKRYGIKLVL